MFCPKPRQRVYGTVAENQEGRGPCYLHTEGIKEEQGKDLLKAYLNMAPSQTLKWIESGKEPNEQDVEIEGTEPYIVGGHTASGYWIDDARRTTLKGLYAAGDVAGGCPQKYVTGALVEGEIAAETILKDLKQEEEGQQSEGQASKEQLEKLAQAVDQEYESCFAPTPCAIVPVGAIVSLQRSAIKRISKVVISAPAKIPIAYPAPVLNGGYHILCLENPGLFGR